MPTLAVMKEKQEEKNKIFLEYARLKNIEYRLKNEISSLKNIINTSDHKNGLVLFEIEDNVKKLEEILND